MDKIILDSNKIDEIFQENDHQIDVTIALYKLVYPNWNDITLVDGYPTINEFTSKYIMGKFIEFDKKYHPDVMNGGCWMNKGFSALYGESLKDWECIPANYS